MSNRAVENKMNPISRKQSPTAKTQLPRLVRPGCIESQRPDAGGESIGCQARMTGGILPAPPRRHTSRCASEGGILSARPVAAPQSRLGGTAWPRFSEQRPPVGFGPPRSVRRLPSSPHNQSRLLFRGCTQAFYQSSRIGGAVGVWCVVVRLRLGSTACLATGYSSRY